MNQRKSSSGINSTAISISMVIVGSDVYTMNGNGRTTIIPEPLLLLSCITLLFIIEAYDTIIIPVTIIAMPMSMSGMFRISLS